MSEKSCGIVLYSVERGKAFYLLLHYPSGHWDFPKGHVEKGEAEEETARRELLEETGIREVEFLPGFRERISYFYRKEGKAVYKEVFFFAARTGQKDVGVSQEHLGFEWLAFPEALERITYANSKEVLKKADAKIRAELETRN